MRAYVYLGKRGAVRRYRGMVKSGLIKQLSDALDETIEITTKTLAVRIFKDLILESPVDTGSYKSSWNFAVGAVDKSILPKEEAGQKLSEGGNFEANTAAAAGKALAKMNANVGKIRGDTIVYLTNAIHYAADLERGYSRTQAPGGIVNVVYPRHVAWVQGKVKEMKRLKLKNK